MAGQIQIQQSAIARAWTQLGGDGTWLELRTKAGSTEDFVAAVEQANQVAEARGDGADAYAAFPASTPRGFAVQLIRATTLEVVRAWTSDLAAGLAERGFNGILGGAPESVPIPCLYPTEPPVPTGYVAWVLEPAEHGHRPDSWAVGPAATTRIAELADRWARRPGAQLVLRQHLYSLAIRLDDAAPQLARAVQESGMAGVEFVLDRETCATQAALAFGGEGVFQLVGFPGGWQTQVDTLTEALVALPADTNQAYIRISTRGVYAQDLLDSWLPLPGIKERHVRYNKHLLDRYLPDAHGVQVVRTAHLERARDLSDWQITDLGFGRHLVRAPDLAPWYADALPDPDVLAKARADFAGALLTEQVIADNPPPR